MPDDIQLTATREEAEKVAADLTAKAQAQADTALGSRAATGLYAAVAMIEMAYGFGSFGGNRV